MGRKGEKWRDFISFGEHEPGEVALCIAHVLRCLCKARISWTFDVRNVRKMLQFYTRIMAEFHGCIMVGFYERAMPRFYGSTALAVSVCC